MDAVDLTAFYPYNPKNKGLIGLNKPRLPLNLIKSILQRKGLVPIICNIKNI